MKQYNQRIESFNSRKLVERAFDALAHHTCTSQLSKQMRSLASDFRNHLLKRNAYINILKYVLTVRRLEKFQTRSAWYKLKVAVKRSQGIQNINEL